MSDALPDILRAIPARKRDTPYELNELNELRSSGVPESYEVNELSGGMISLRDGRRLYRFHAGEIPAAFDIEIIEMMDRARRCGAVLVADGMTLDVVEPRRRLMPEMLTDLQRDAGAVIAVLRGESRQRSRVISS